MATVLFFEEDEVAMYSEATGYRCGIVTESSEYFSSDEDDEGEYETYERLRKGTVRVAWHPDGKSQVLKESELKLADRSLMPGDVVRRFIKGEDSQRGSVTATRIKCHLQVIGKPYIICNVDTKDIQPLSQFTTHSGDVHLDSWVGRLVNIIDRITLRFCDGARCEVSDEETLDLLLDFKDAFDKQPKETAFATMTFFEGQVLKGEFGSLQDAKWLKNTKSFNKASARKFHSREVVVTVEKVETFQLEINWICRGYSSHEEMTPTAMQPPPRIIKGEQLGKVKHLDCFESSNYQIGDRAFYHLKDSDKLVILNPKDRHSAIHRVIQYDNNSSMDGIVSIITDHETDNTMSDDSRGTSANRKTQTDEDHNRITQTDEEPSEIATTKPRPDEKPSEVATKKTQTDEEPSEVVTKKTQTDEEPSEVATKKTQTDEEPSEVTNKKTQTDEEPSEIATRKIQTDEEPSEVASRKTQTDEEPAESDLEKKDGQEHMEPKTTQSDTNTVVPDESANASAAAAAATSALQTKVPSEKKAKTTGVKKTAAQVKQLRKKKLKPTKVKPQNLCLDITLPMPGQRLPVELIYTSTLVDVTWQDGTNEVDIPSTDLLPIHHLDELEFFPGDYVASSSEIQMYDVYGVVQSVDHRGRTCKVKWLSHSNMSSIDTVIKVEEVSVYDIKDHPDLKFRPGHVVVRVGAEPGNGPLQGLSCVQLPEVVDCLLYGPEVQCTLRRHGNDVLCNKVPEAIGMIVKKMSIEQRATNDSSDILRPIGQVFELCCDGQMVIQWDDRTQSCCYPMQLYLVGDEATDFGDSDSEDSFLSEEESSSEESCEWETEEEEWGPVEEGVSVEGIVEWSSLPTCSSKELLLVVTDLKEVTKKIEDLVSTAQTKGSTQASAKFFRQLVQLFRVCREFDHVAGTKVFENEELVSLMAEIKKLNKKMKSQHHNKQVPVEGPEPKSKESEVEKSNRPAQKNGVSGDESGNDSGLEKSPSGSELREIKPSDVSQPTDDFRTLPAEGSSGISLSSESAAETHDLAPSDTTKLESCLDGAAAIAQAIDKLEKESAAETGKEATAPLESTVTDLPTTLTKLCEQLMKLGKVYLNSEAESGKLCISALQLLGQVIVSNTENISAAFRSSASATCDSTSEEKSLPRETGSEASKDEAVSVQNGLSESGNCPNDASLPVEASTAVSNGWGSLGQQPVESAAAMSTPIKAPALDLKLGECQSVTDEEADAVSKTPVTPAEIRAKVEFNPEGFTLVDSMPEFHHFKDQKHTPVNATAFMITIRREMKLLHSCLPNGIYVKGFESRMDLFSIMIEGPSRTPYEDGLFFFDVQLPNNYPSSPPLFFYISYCSDRLNPNLYEDGKVCVSLLGTWTGKGTEVWHSKSNLLQVLISIQGLILNPEPYYNEAGYERQKGTQLGLENSRMYNEMAILKMVQSMTKIAVNPFRPFASEIRLHLMNRAYKMINRLRYWISAIEVLSPRMLTTKTDELGSEASSLTSPSNESKPGAAVVSSPSKTSDSKKSEPNGEASPETGSEECVPLDLLENSDKVDTEATPDLPDPINSCASTSSTSDPRSQSSVEALCSFMLDNADAALLPAFPLLPVSKGFKISLSKCLDNFESMLTSIGISPKE